MQLVLNIHDVSEALSLSKTKVYALMKTGKFPSPRRLSKQRVGWLAREVEAWAESRPISDIPPPANTGAKKPKRPQAPQDDLKAA